MQSTRRWILFFVLAVLTLPGCLYRTEVRHLSSDVGLIVQGQSTKQEVLVYLGDPDEKRVLPGGEEWIYSEVHPSLMRKTPYIGSRLGSEEQETAIVTFEGDVVRTCVYRVADEQPLPKIGEPQK